MAFLKITKIDTHVLLVPDVNPEAMSSSQDEFRKHSFVASTIRVCWAHRDAWLSCTAEPTAPRACNDLSALRLPSRGD
jgi:hypothetical protein